MQYEDWELNSKIFGFAQLCTSVTLPFRSRLVHLKQHTILLNRSRLSYHVLDFLMLVESLIYLE